MVKFITVTGSLISGLGKGITSSSIGLLLRARGINVTYIKIDPYLNIDSGTLSPYEHGECFTLADGGESDLDLGNCERFLDIELTSDHSITTGKVYNNVLQKERRGEYLGKTVQIIPHITDEIQRLILKAANKPLSGKQPDICIIELGGTIGDLETSPFIEAIRLLSNKNKSNFCFVHLSMIICLDENPKNYKTKPTQHSVAKLREQGLGIDILVMRTPTMLIDELKEKLSMFCGVAPQNVISNINVPNIYYVPRILEQQNICDKINHVLGFDKLLHFHSPDLNQYNQIINYYDRIKVAPIQKKYKLLIAGKYTGTQDTYLSLIRAIEHAVFDTNQHHDEIIVDIQMMDVENYYEKNDHDLINADAVIIPGGFGSRGIREKLRVAKYCRENKKPMLGICLGMQVMVCEFAKNVCGIDAKSDEWTDVDGKDSVVCLLPDQNEIKGGTMRLGEYVTMIQPNTLAHKLYGHHTISERHRHRYEINNTYVDQIQDHGLKFVGKNETMNLMEIVETEDHPFYLGCQYHPEFKSKYNRSHPLFNGLIKAMIE